MEFSFSNDHAEDIFVTIEGTLKSQLLFYQGEKRLGQADRIGLSPGQTATIKVALQPKLKGTTPHGGHCRIIEGGIKLLLWHHRSTPKASVVTPLTQCLDKVTLKVTCCLCVLEGGSNMLGHHPVWLLPFIRRCLGAALLPFRSGPLWASALSSFTPKYCTSRQWRAEPSSNGGSPWRM